MILAAARQVTRAPSPGFCRLGAAGALAACPDSHHGGGRLVPTKSPDPSCICLTASTARTGILARPTVVQFVAVLLWLSCHMRSGLCPDLRAVGLAQWLAALVLFGYGQSLNAGIFKAIGHVGVYYGFKLGHTVPWVNGWPFDTVSHPQYVGSVLSVWAGVALLWGQVAPPLLVVLGLYWTALYVATAVHEDRA